MYVLDGGALLQRLPWPKKMTYGELCQLYVQYIQRHYNKAVIVFDGYDSGPSTKDETHRRRHNNVIGADVEVGKTTQLRMKKSTFLTNSKNKQKFIFLLGEELEKCPNVQARHSPGDADYDIAMSACAVALAQPVVVVAEDTDLLVLLQHHFIPGKHQALFFQTSSNLINIMALKSNLPPELSASLLFIHVITGCDTTSRPYGIGKSSVLNKYALLSQYSDVFLQANQSIFETETAGNLAMAILYGGDEEHALESLRVSNFSEKVVTGNKYIPPERLPPTSDSANFHSQRVYLQVQAWLGNNMDPT